MIFNLYTDIKPCAIPESPPPSKKITDKSLLPCHWLIEFRSKTSVIAIKWNPGFKTALNVLIKYQMSLPRRNTVS